MADAATLVIAAHLSTLQLFKRLLKTFLCVRDRGALANMKSFYLLACFATVAQCGHGALVLN